MRRQMGVRMALLLVVTACAVAAPVSGASASKARHQDRAEKLLRQGRRCRRSRADGARDLQKHPRSGAGRRGDRQLGEGARELRSKIAAQSASKPTVKTAKTKLLKGIAAVVVAYEHLGTAYQEHESDPPRLKRKPSSRSRS